MQMREANKGYRRRDRKTDNKPPSEDADVVADALLLVLGYALGNPGDVSDFLEDGSVKDGTRNGVGPLETDDVPAHAA